MTERPYLSQLSTHSSPGSSSQLLQAGLAGTPPTGQTTEEDSFSLSEDVTSEGDIPGTSCREPEVEGTGYLSPNVGEKSDQRVRGMKGWAPPAPGFSSRSHFWENFQPHEDSDRSECFPGTQRAGLFCGFSRPSCALPSPSTTGANARMAL